jgi:hypothetical protein
MVRNHRIAEDLDKVIVPMQAGTIFYVDDVAKSLNDMENRRKRTPVTVKTAGMKLRERYDVKRLSNGKWQKLDTPNVQPHLREEGVKA